MTFRSYRPDDRAACLSLFDSNTPPYFDPSERVHFEEFLDGHPQPYFVLEEADRIVACGGVARYPDRSAGVTLSPTSAGLKWGMVARDRQRQGIGQRLVEFRTNWLREYCPEIIELKIATSQHTRPFYERQGFEVASMTPDGFAPGLDEVQMRLKLGQF